MFSRHRPERSHKTSARMDSEEQRCTEAAQKLTSSSQQSNMGLLTQQFSVLKVGAPRLKEPLGSHESVQNQCHNHRKSNLEKCFDRNSHKTTHGRPELICNPTMSPGTMPVKSKRRGDEKNSTADSTTISTAGAIGPEKTGMSEPSTPPLPSVKMARGDAGTATVSTDHDAINDPPAPNGFNDTTTWIDIPISLEENLKKLSLKSPEVLLERGRADRSRFARKTIEEKPYTKPEGSRPQTTARSSVSCINYDDDDETFVHALLHAPSPDSTAGGIADLSDEHTQTCIPNIVFEKMNEKEPVKKTPTPRRKKGQASTKANVSSSTEHLSNCQNNLQGLTNHRAGLSATSMFGGPGQQVDVSFPPLTMANQTTVSQAGNETPTIQPASKNVCYQQPGMPTVSGNDTSPLTASPLHCGQQPLFSVAPHHQHDQQRGNVLAMDTFGCSASVIPDGCGLLTGPSRPPIQMQFNSCNSNKSLTIAPQTMAGLAVGSSMNAGQETVGGPGWQNEIYGGQKINYCLPEQRVMSDRPQVASAPAHPTTACLIYTAESNNRVRQQNHGLDRNNTVSQQHVPASLMGSTMVSVGQHMPNGLMEGNIAIAGQQITAGQISGTMANGGQEMQPGQMGCTMVSVGQHMPNGLMEGNIAIAGQQITAGQISGTMAIGGQEMQLGQMRCTMTYGGQHMAAAKTGGVILNGGQQMPAGQIGCIMVNESQQMTAGPNGYTMVNGGQGVAAGQLIATMVNRGQHMPADQMGSIMLNGGQEVAAGQLIATMVNRGQHMPADQMGSIMLNGGQQMQAGQMGGVVLNGGQQMPAGQMVGTMLNGGQHMPADQMGTIMLNGGQQMPAGQIGGAMLNGGQQMPAGQMGGTMVNAGQQIPAGQMGGAMVNGGQQMPAGQMGGTMVNGGQQMPAGQMGGVMLNGGQQMPAGEMEGTIVNGGQDKTAGQIGCTMANGALHMPADLIESIMANEGQQIGMHRMMRSRTSSPLAILITLGRQWPNERRNSTRFRTLLPKQK
ncbi:uncharacterized protein [Haliotis cracherodii]